MSRFVRMFKPQFAALVKSGAKRQTIRPTPKRMPKSGDAIDCREWSGKPYRSNQVKLGEWKVARVQDITIDSTSIECTSAPEWLICGFPHFDIFARADGFKDWAEMRDWFEREHGLPFEGILISWEYKKGGANE